MTFTEFKTGLTTEWEKQVRKMYSPSISEMIISTGPTWSEEVLLQKYNETQK